MPEVKSTHNLFSEVPNEILDVIFHFLPQYSLIGEHSVQTVSQQWNDVITSSTLLNHKLTSKQLVQSIQTEEEALHFLENAKICDEMDYKWLLRLAFKIPKVRDVLLRRLSIEELLVVTKHDVNLARFCLEFDLNYFTPKDRLLISRHHEALSLELLDGQDLSASDAVLLSKHHLSIARHILNTPKLSRKFTAVQRFSIIWNHTQLVEENLELCGNVLEEQLDEDNGGYRMFGIFLKKHRYSHIVADFLINQFDEIFTLRPDFLASIASCHLDVARELFAHDDVVKELNYDLLLEIIDAHFEMAEQLITKPDLVMKENYADTVFNIILKHFPRSKCFLFDEKYHLKADFYQAYGPVLALPRMQKMLATESASAYDFKVAFARSLFDHPEIMLQNKKELMHVLADIIDELHSDDFKSMHTAIIKLFHNQQLRSSLDKMLALKLIGKMPFLLDEQHIKDKYFSEVFVFDAPNLSLEYISYRSTYLPRHPLIARKIMNDLNLANSVPYYVTNTIGLFLGTRDLIKQTAEQVRLEISLKDSALSFKP